ncbi:MAG: TetR family transcriptional regulator [Phycisphaerae bacterium]|nr:TetR family transcriptional regulator [Phycisphaerae bacterium]
MIINDKNNIEQSSNKNLSTDKTCDKILNAAEELFAEKGYNAVSVRAITAKAQCNLAAVNYHFGNKANLYKEVFTRFLTDLRENKLAAINNVMESEDATLEKLLSGFCKNFIETHSSGRFSKLHSLMQREEVTPLLPQDLFLGQFRKPVMERLAEAFKKLCPGLSVEDCFLCVESTISQMLHLCMVSQKMNNFKSPLRLLPVKFGSKDYVKKSIDHIVFFCKAGIEALNDKNRNKI